MLKFPINSQSCNVCDLTFILEEALLFHLKTEHAQKIDTLNCADCSLEFFSKGRESERKSSEKSAIFDDKLAISKMAELAVEA